MYLIYTELSKLLTNRVNIIDGKIMIIDFITRYFPEYNIEILRNLDFSSLKDKILNWIKNTFNLEPYSKDIKAFWFGIFEVACTQFNMIELYLSGSTKSFEMDNADWMCIREVSYWPEKRYAQLSEFKALYNSMDNIETFNLEAGDLRIFVFHAILYLIIPLLINENPQLFLKNAQEIYLGLGQDDMDFYIYGKIDENGLSGVLEMTK